MSIQPATASDRGYQTVLFEKKDRIATVTINRPKVMNAMNPTVIEELRAAFTEVRRDPGLRGAILTGAGDKSFAAGTDLSSVAQETALEAQEFMRAGKTLLTMIESLGKPVIAAVNGYALGGGLEIAMACTFRIAAEEAHFGQPEVKWGIMPCWGGTQRLPRLVGPGRALQFILTGAFIDAQEALRIGLVNEVVPRTEAAPARGEDPRADCGERSARRRVLDRGRPEGARQPPGGRAGARERAQRRVHGERRSKRGSGRVRREARAAVPGAVMAMAQDNIFSGLKVVDMASWIAGPGATTILGEFGADVIKVEPPGNGDGYRMLYEIPPHPRAEANYAWNLTNRNKRGLALNLKSKRAGDVVKRLAEWADVFVTNFPPPVRKAPQGDLRGCRALQPEAHLRRHHWVW